jgi:hemerythrin superfamily protein
MIFNSDWTYNGNIFTSEDITDNFGFIYRITDIENDKLYLGRKNFFSLRKDTKVTTAKRKKRIRKESDWKKYYGSSTLIKESVKEQGADKFKREILLLCKSQGELNYNETKYLFQYNVLEDDRYYNDNIIGRYYSKNVKKYDSSL